MTSVFATAPSDRTALLGKGRSMLRPYKRFLISYRWLVTIVLEEAGARSASALLLAVEAKRGSLKISAQVELNTVAHPPRA